MKRVIDSGLALLVYGLLFQMLADWLRRSGDGLRREAYNAAQRKLAEERRASRTYASPA